MMYRNYPPSQSFHQLDPSAFEQDRQEDWLEQEQVSVSQEFSENDDEMSMMYGHSEGHNATAPYSMAMDDNADDTRDSISNDSDDDNDDCSTSKVLEKIENLMESIIDALDRNELPQIGRKSFGHMTQCRSLTSILMVASFCYDLLKSNRTTTTREVYYYFVTHFRNQAECDKAIRELCAALKIQQRSALGLVASPKGWYCGCIKLYNDSDELIVNGRELDPHGMAITATTANSYRRIESSAYCILVIEKEGVYTRLSEDKFFLHYYPCILVTGKGFPDVATRQWVQQLQRELELPVFGLCDCNPYGVSVLNTYCYGYQDLSDGQQQRSSKYRDTSGLEIQWIGLRPSQLEELDLPANAFQQPTALDKKRLKSLQNKDHPFHNSGWNPQQRLVEINQMNIRKVELEALNWKGMDFLCEWVYHLLQEQDAADADGVEVAEYII